MGSDSRHKELTPFADEENGADGDLADGPVDPHMDVQASHRRDFNASRELCNSSNVDLTEDTGCVFSLALQKLTAILERNFAVTVIADDLKRVHIFEEIAAVSLAYWTLEKLDMVCKRDMARKTVEHSIGNSRALCKRVFAHPFVQSALFDAQDASSMFIAR